MVLNVVLTRALSEKIYFKCTYVRSIYRQSRVLLEWRSLCWSEFCKWGVWLYVWRLHLGSEFGPPTWSQALSLTALGCCMITTTLMYTFFLLYGLSTYLMNLLLLCPTIYPLLLPLLGLKLLLWCLFLDQMAMFLLDTSGEVNDLSLSWNMTGIPTLPLASLAFFWCSTLGCSFVGIWYDVGGLIGEHVELFLVDTTGTVLSSFNTFDLVG